MWLRQKITEQTDAIELARTPTWKCGIGNQSESTSTKTFSLSYYASIHLPVPSEVDQSPDPSVHHEKHQAFLFNTPASLSCPVLFCPAYLDPERMSSIWLNSYLIRMQIVHAYIGRGAVRQITAKTFERMANGMRDWGSRALLQDGCQACPPGKRNARRERRSSQRSPNIVLIRSHLP